MSFRFRVFRRILLGLIITLCCVSVGLVISILPTLNRRQTFWMIVSIQSACLLRSLWSALRKPLSKCPQSVATEITSLFFLLPFELVVTLVAGTSPLEREHTSNPLPLVIQIFILSTTIINSIYTASLLLISLITSAAYDSKIWIRDIDSSPSPFPVPVIANFVFPCLFQSPPSPALAPIQSLVRERHNTQASICLPGCQCTSKPQPISPELSSVEMAQGRLSQSLVRVPDAAQRRHSIAVTFEV